MASGAINAGVMASPFAAHVTLEERIFALFEPSLNSVRLRHRLTTLSHRLTSALLLLYSTHGRHRPTESGGRHSAMVAKARRDPHSRTARGAPSSKVRRMRASDEKALLHACVYTRDHRIGRAHRSMAAQQIRQGRQRLRLIDRLCRKGLGSCGEGTRRLPIMN